MSRFVPDIGNNLYHHIHNPDEYHREEFTGIIDPKCRTCTDLRSLSLETMSDTTVIKASQDEIRRRVN